MTTLVLGEQAECGAAALRLLSQHRLDPRRPHPEGLCSAQPTPEGTQPPQPCCLASPTFEIQTRSRLSLGTKPTVPGHVSLQYAKPRVRLGILYTNCLHSSSQCLTAHEHSVPFQRVKPDLNLCTAGVLWPHLPVSLWLPGHHVRVRRTLLCPWPLLLWALLPFLSQLQGTEGPQSSPSLPKSQKNLISDNRNENKMES